MNYTTYLPGPALAPYIDSYWTLEGPSDCDAPWDRILPDGSVEFVFNLGDHFQRTHPDNTIEIQPAALLVGQMCHFAMIRPTGSVRLFGVRFHPHGAYPFLHIPLHEFTDRIVSLNTVLNTLGTELSEMIAGALSIQESICSVEKVLCKRLKQKCATDPAVMRATRMMVRSKGALRMSEYARGSGLSERQLERKFQTQVGLSPKRFSRILRMQELFKVLERDRRLSWSYIASECGYFDQAHFIHEFRDFAGQTPELFFDEKRILSRFFTRARRPSDSYNT